MADKFFLDTAVFIHSFDQLDMVRQTKSRALIAKALQGKGCICWQVVQEFSNVAMRGFETAFDHGALREYLDAVLLPLCALYPDKGIYMDAIGLQQETRFTWQDSLMVTSAIRLGCSSIYSDILPHGQIVRGLKIVDPYA